MKFSKVDAYVHNNPINRIDPDGNLDYGVNDWLKLKDGSVKFDASVNNQAQATAKYGAGTTDLGASATLLSNAGNQLSLNSNGTASNATMLNEVSVSAKSDRNSASADDAAGLALDAQAGVMGVAQAMDNIGDAAQGFATVGNVLEVLGKASGVVGAFGTLRETIDNPSVGNFLKLGVDVGLVAFKINPIIGIADGILSVTGIKDAGFRALDRKIDNYKFNNVVNSQSVDPTKIKVK